MSRRQQSAGASLGKGEPPADSPLSDLLWGERAPRPVEDPRPGPDWLVTDIPDDTDRLDIGGPDTGEPASRRPRADGPRENADVPDADPESVARTILLRRLDAAPRTRAELAADLRKRNVPDDVAERVLDRYVEVGLIDDAAYARMWVASRQRTRGSARPVLRQELRRKGVDDDLIAAALAEIDPDDEAERARELVARKLPALARYDLPTRKRRLVSMLVRRGYSQGLAFAVVRDALADDALTDDLSGLD